MGCCGSSSVKEVKPANNTKPSPAQRPNNNNTTNQQQPRRASNNYDHAPPPHTIQQQQQQQPNNNSINGRRLGSNQNGQGVVETEEERRQKMANAALARQTSTPGISEGAIKRIETAQTRDELIGRVQGLCHRLKEDPPIGLTTCSVEQLRKHAEYLETKVKEKRR
eukprot:PhF_6_TR27129/c0_g1_i2/m.39564